MRYWWKENWPWVMMGVIAGLVVMLAIVGISQGEVQQKQDFMQCVQNTNNNLNWCYDKFVSQN